MVESANNNQNTATEQPVTEADKSINNQAAHQEESKDNGA